MPYAQFLRLKRNSSNDTIFRKHALKLKRALRLRGYPNATIDRAFKKANKHSRATLLTRKADRLPAGPKTPQPADDFADSFKYIAKFDPRADWTSTKHLIKDTHAAALTFYQQRALLSTNDDERHDAATAARVLSERESTLVFSIHNSTKDALTKNYKKPKAD